jgi:hypothetical protein
MGPNAMGEYNHELNQISLNENLLQGNSPDQCMETYTHKKR